MKQKPQIGPWVFFYAMTLLLLLILAAFFAPTAGVLRRVAEAKGQGPAILIPLSFLLISFLFAFLKARSLGRKRRWVAAYGWLMGAGALATVLLLTYLKKMTGS
ncbi:hypothetical protein [Nitratifractor sp.]